MFWPGMSSVSIGLAVISKDFRCRAPDFLTLSCLDELDERQRKAEQLAEAFDPVKPAEGFDPVTPVTGFDPAA